jgi:hypothetical protein
MLVLLAGCGGAAGTSTSDSSPAAQPPSHAPASRAASASNDPASRPADAPVSATAPAPLPTTPSPTSTPTSTSTTTTTPAPTPAVSALPPKPTIHQWPIPFGAARKRQMAAYSLRHYGEDSYALRNPKVIVEHYTETSTAQEAYNTFAPDVPDSEFHELPNTCAHFLVEPSGRIDQLVPLSLRCRHTVGLNWTAIGIENVGLSDQAILEDHAQISASLRLTRWLRCLYAIPLRDVIGHNESLSSPYHHDRVPAFQHQTHSDWNHADMQRYRALLARGGCA